MILFACGEMHMDQITITRGLNLAPLQKIES